MKGNNEDNLIFYAPNVRTLKCLNPFCGFTFAEDMDEVSLRVLDISTPCPKCGGKETKIVNYDFKGIVLAKR